MNILKKPMNCLPGAAMFILLMSWQAAGMASTRKGATQSPPVRQTNSLEDRVHHAILMLPYYDVFDEITFSIRDNTVTLAGEVRRPLLKSEAEYAVRMVNGVANVVNDIEILPFSSMDDAIRLMTYRAIYSQSGFEKYNFQAVKPIRIIVKNGHVKLVGVVASKFDKTMADAAAWNVPFTFFVSDDLAVG